MVNEFRTLALSDIITNPDTATQKYFNEIHKSGLGKIILSSEIFENTGMPVDKLKEFLDGRFFVKIIFYVRRQDEKTESAYNEAVKDFQTHYDKPVTEFIKIFSESERGDSVNPPLPEKRLIYTDYYSLLIPWRDTFGRDNIIIRCYEEEQLPDGIYYDFLDTVGLVLNEKYRIPQRRINESLSRDLTEFFRICNASIKTDSDFNSFLLRNLRQIQLENTEKKQRLLSPQQRRDIISLFEESNAKVAREYLGRSDGRLFYAPLPDLQEPWKPYEGLTVEKIVPIFIQMIFNHNKMCQKQERELERQSLKQRIIRIIKTTQTRFGL